MELLALDVDGTVLDPAGKISPGTSRAIRRVESRGVRVVLCTGRRFGRALPIARELNLRTPLICNSGALIKESDRYRTLWRADFQSSLFEQLIRIFRDRDHPMIGYLDGPFGGLEFVVPSRSTGKPGFDEYVELNAEHAEVDDGWPEVSNDPGREVFHVCAVGTRRAMLDFEASLLDGLSGQIRTFVQKSPRYTGWICELIRHDASKWSALLHLAEHWGIDPGAIVAVGDDRNDVPMIEAAGLGVAMGHAPPEVREVADLVVGDNDRDGLAEFLESVLIPGLDRPDAA